MELHNPPNLNLPPLKIKKKRERQSMENNLYISNLIQSNLLLDKEFHSLFILISKNSEEIDSIIESFKGESYLFGRIMPSSSISYARNRYIHYSLLERRLEKGNIKEFSKKERDEINKRTDEAKKDYFKKSITSTKRRSSKIQNELSRFETSRNIKMEILTPTTLFICKKCRNILSRDHFRQASCLCGATIKTISNTIKVPIAYFNKLMRDFISQNFWFEYGIDYLLRRRNFQTLCGYHVLGHSGNMHEIDNIAESKSNNFRFFCECKSGSIRVSDVFILSGKMADIGCSRGYFFVLEKDLPKEIKHLARSRNISIVTGVLERSETELLEEIRE